MYQTENLDRRVESASFCNLSTENEIMSISNIQGLSQNNICEDNKPSINFIEPSCDLIRSTTMQIDCNTNPDIFHNFLEVSPRDSNFLVRFDAVYKKQKRNHKKKRINKKWAKKYGYIDVIVTYEGDVSLTESSHYDNEIDVEFTNCKLVGIEGAK